jgi:hypothetical protein
MSELIPGAKIRVRDAFGRILVRRALSGEVMGSSFLVVWACREEEWETALAEGREPEGIPWPAEDVRPSRAR